MKENKQFQAESRRLLDLMINSIYSEKEIFLRELIANASDAIDKYKYLSLTDHDHYPSDDYEIRITVDEKKRYIEISDNGIGMSKDEIDQNLGTIASSGSKDFLERYKNAKSGEELSIIGQFGVGFYSAFMVARKVEVYTRSVGNPCYCFSSDGQEGYSVEDSDEIPTHGTKVRVYLKKDEEEVNYGEYLQSYTIERLVKKYNDYVRYPIRMLVSTTKPVFDDEGNRVEGKETTVTEDKTLNSMVPLWKKSPKEVTDEELSAFYQANFHDHEAPLLSLFVQIEGVVDYNAMLFVPAHPPYDLYSEHYEKGLALYCKEVFIQEKCKELVPDYLKFLRGIVDSDSLPLNISREMLQKTPALSKIASSLEKRFLDKLKSIQKEDKAKYEEFFRLYGDHIKFGIYSTYGMKKEDLQDLLLFHHLNGDAPITLKEYCDACDKEQKAIYYAAGKKLEEIKMLPQLERYKKKGQDVLLLDKPIDEFAISMLYEYAGKQLQNIASVSSEEAAGEEKDRIDSLTATHKRILDEIQVALKGKVDQVVFSDKLVDSPVCITTKDGLSLNMESVLAEQPGEEAREEAPKATRVLEINADSDLFQAIATLDSDEDIQHYGALLYDEALLLEGYEIEDKKGFVANLNSLMMKALKK